MSKAKRHTAIRARAARAIRALYHNASPRYPRLDDEAAERFQEWFQFAAESEIEYIQEGGASGGHDYRETLEHPANAGKYTSERARRYYVNWHLRARDEERARCNRLDSRESQVNALWERISDYGELYQYGRGGRTLAPSKLVQDRGPSFGVDSSYADELPIAETVTLIQIVESFNQHVEQWCESIPEQWEEADADRIECETAEAEAQADEAWDGEIYAVA